MDLVGLREGPELKRSGRRGDVTESGLSSENVL